MNVEVRLLNCLWLLVPILAWNVMLGPRLALEAVTSDAHSPAWLLYAENAARLFVFVLPLLLSLQWKSQFGQAGLSVYVVGTLLYFASWLPLLIAPQSAWSASALGLLAPRLTPLLPFLGIALIGQSWLYGLVAAAFIALHTWHGVQNLALA